MLGRVLVILWIIQVVSNKGRNKKLGKGFSVARRVNPFNPFSYIALVLIFIVGIFMFGVVGAWKELDMRNVFKWY